MANGWFPSFKSERLREGNAAGGAGRVNFVENWFEISLGHTCCIQSMSGCSKGNVC